MALLHLFLCFCALQALPAFSFKMSRKCSPSRDSFMKLEDQYNIQISELDYSITYDYMDKITERPSARAWQVYFGSVNVNISGHFYPKEKYADFKMSRQLNTGPFAVKRTVENEKSACKMIESKQLFEGFNRTKDSMTPKERAKFTVYGLIIDCLEIQICQQYDILEGHDFLEYTKIEERVSKDIRDYYAEKEAEEAEIKKEKSLQVAINSIFDFGVSVGMSQWADENGIFHVPKVQKDFSYFKLKGNFIASDISVEGLATMKRTKDVIFTNAENRYTMGTTVRLSKVKLNIPSYRLRYPLKNVEGHLITAIEGLTLTIQISVDYNAALCEIHLDEMKIYEVGDIDVDFAGLGMIWDKIAMEPIIRYTIRNYVFEAGIDAIAEKASKLNCERFRPTLEIANNN